MRKWQVDTKVYSNRRNELLRAIAGVPWHGDVAQATRDFTAVVRNFDIMLTSISEMNWCYRYQERTPHGYRKAVTRVEKCLSEIEQLATIFLLTYCSE